MNQHLWTEVDRYISDKLLPSDPVFDSVLATSEAAGLPPHNVSPTQGKMLQLFARMQNARSILEIGTLGGYSTIWMARALPSNGRLVTLEADPKHAEVALANFACAGLSNLIGLKLGPALDTLPKVAADDLGPFDLIFIDADKPNNPGYFSWALKLSRLGTLIIGDNVVRDGEVANVSNPDPRVQGTRRLFEMMAQEPRVSATAIQTVGSKGYDGFAMALVVR